MGFYSSSRLFNLTGYGNVGIGTTNPQQKLTVYGPTSLYTTGVSTQPRFIFATDTANVTGNHVMTIYDDGSNTGGYHGYYSVGSGWNSGSDSRYKSNIANLNLTDSLNFISNLTPKVYNLNFDSSKANLTGFIGQETLKAAKDYPHFKNSIVGNHTKYEEGNIESPHLGLSYTNMIVPTIHVVQNLLKRVEKLEIINKKLEQRISTLESTNYRVEHILGYNY